MDYFHRGFYIAWTTVIKMLDGFFALLPNLLIAALVFFVFHMIGKLLEKFALNLTHRAHFDRTLSNALSKFASIATNIFAILVCASIVVPGFSPDKLIAGLGITSVAIGFAFQNILQNFFAGILLLWQKPFGIGDEIKTKDFEGTVEDIMIRTTLLRTYTGERVFIPNGLLFTDPVVVNTAYNSRQIRLQMPCGDVPPDKALELAKKALAGVDSLDKNHQSEVYATAAGGSNNLDLYLWSAPQNSSIVKAKADATYAVQRALDQYKKEKAKAKVAAAAA